MMGTGLRRLMTLLALVCALLGFGSGIAMAAVPTSYFTLGTNLQPVPAPPPYNAIGAIYTELLTWHGHSLGQLNEPAQIYIDNTPQHNLWIVDKDNNRVIELQDSVNSQGVPSFNKVLLVIGGPNAKGNYALNKPEGVAVGPQGIIYIADTGNQRIATFAPNGTFLANLNPQNSATWKSQNVPFQPSSVAVSSRGDLYITIPGQTFGLAHFNSNGKFLGFFAPNQLGFTATLFYDIGQLLTSQAQKNQQAVVTNPEVYSVYYGPDGYLYTTSLSVGSKQIRRLNIVGTDTLNTAANHPQYYIPFPALPYYVQSQIVSNAQNAPAGGFSGSLPRFIAVGVDKNGIISALDSLTGFVYQYGPDGKMLYTFGGPSSVSGVMGYFQDPTGLAVTPGGYVLVDDAILDNIQIFQPTQFALLAQKGIGLYVNGFYKQAEKPWNQLLKLDANYDLAHDQLALGYLAQGEALGAISTVFHAQLGYFSKAIHQYYLARDKVGFGTAFGWYRHVWMRINFAWVFGLFLLAWLLVYLAVKFGGPYLRNHPLSFQGAWVRGQFARVFPMMWRVVKHPPEAFFELKYEDQGTLAQGVVLVVLAFVVHLLNLAWTDFDFSPLVAGHSNMLYTSTQFLLPLATWILANYFVGDLYDGEANLAEVITGSAYAMVPFIFLQLPFALFTHALAPSDGIFPWLILGEKIWLVYLFFTQVRVLHNLEWGKAIKASIMTLIGIGVLWTMALIVIGLGVQAVTFVHQVIQDLILLRS